MTILRRSRPRRAVVLLAVLIVVVLLSLAAYQYSDMMLSEYKASDAYTRSTQARAAALCCWPSWWSSFSCRWRPTSTAS